MGSEPARPLSVGVGVATMGRAEECADLLRALQGQTVQPDAIVISCTSEADVAGLDDRPSVTVIYGSPGSSVQRNRILEALAPAVDVIAFLDDDYLPSKFCIERLRDVFAANADVVGANGRLLADGIHSAGVSLPEALQLLAEYDAREDGAKDARIAEQTVGLYGCNMAFRSSAIGEIRFDERLPLYGWQEDIDFSARLMSRGRLVNADAFVGVHRGVKRGRTSGVRLGYSQVANPLYLVRKGTMKWSYALKILSRNVLANHARQLRPEPWIDRAGRARGNRRAFVDLLLGRLNPERILDF